MNQYLINNHILTNKNRPLIYKNSPNQSGLIVPTVIVMHYTAGRGFSQSLETLTKKLTPPAGVSAHLLIGRNGEVAQMVNFNKKAWHAGTSVWNGKEGVNSFSIGIELDNYGILTKTGNKFVTYFGTEVPAENVYTDEKGRHWHAYTHDQLEELIDITKALLKAYPTIKEIIGHENICVPFGRKSDPGAAFPMAVFQALLKTS